MALMVLVAVFVDIPRAWAVVYLFVFCTFALWMVEGQEVRPKQTQQGLMDGIKIANGKS